MGRKALGDFSLFSWLVFSDRISIVIDLLNLNLQKSWSTSIHFKYVNSSAGYGRGLQGFLDKGGK